MPRFTTQRAIKHRRSTAQKRHTVACTRSHVDRRALQDQNRPPTPSLTATATTPCSSTSVLSPSDKKSIKSLRNTISYHKTALRKSRSSVLELKEENRQLRGSLETSHLDKHSTAQQLLIAQSGLSSTRLELLESKKSAASLIFSSNAYLAWTCQEHASTSAIAAAELSRLSLQNKLLSSKVCALRKKSKVTNDSLQRLLKWKKDHRSKHLMLLKSKGVYTARTRAIIRTLVTAGCSQKNVGSVIKSVGSLLDINISGNISKRTVRRTIIEGGVASSIQVGHALATSNSCTFSDDATSHRHINYESRHIALRNAATGMPQIFFLGVESATNHSSATQLSGWLTAIGRINSTFSDSPFATRKGLTLSDADVALKLHGTNGDHAADQKKKHSLLFEWKMCTTYTSLGSSVLLGISQEQVLHTVADAMLNKINGLGGHNVWIRISLREREAHEIEVMKELALQTGKQAYSMLSEPDKRNYELFFRGGCCMHKDLNAVRCGDKEMTDVWKLIGVSGPVILPNRDNHTTISDSSSGQTACARALEASGRGGVKASSLAGSLFNNKDKKKGQQDSYCWYFFNVLGYTVTFPDTSNTRYGSHCNAAAELIAHLPVYIEFLEFVRDKKGQATFTNIEQNLCKALRCPSTITELAVLATYGQTVSIPYMAVVRGHEATIAGALDMGSIQLRVIQHVRCFRDKLDLFIDTNATPEHSTFNGGQWHSNEVFYAIKALLPSLPHFRHALYSFLTGALAAWVRFSEDYQPDGHIGMATQDERIQAYMPPTNDINEGALGTKRQDARIRPNHSGLSFNAITSVKRNNTEDFIASELNTVSDARYLRSVARSLDSGGLEAKTKLDQSIYDRTIVEEKRQKVKGKAEKVRLLQATLDEITLTSDANILAKEKKELLELRLKKYRHLIYEIYGVSRKDFDIPVQSKITRKADRISQIARCHERYLSIVSLSSEIQASDNVDVDNDHELDSDHDMDSI